MVFELPVLLGLLARDEPYEDESKEEYETEKSRYAAIRLFPLTAPWDWCGAYERAIPGPGDDWKNVELGRVPDMPRRAVKELERRRAVTTLGQLVEMTFTELTMIKGVGVATSIAVEDCLKKIGLSLKSETEE